ncbi:MAG: sigma-54 dependent transcriptional regulator [Elusimicrobiota bacterium]
MNKILIIDDDENIQISLTNLFKIKNYNPKVVGTAQSALEELRKCSYDVVFLDIHLPDKDGLTCLEKIKEIDEYIPVVILTAYGDVRQAVKAMKLGAFDYLTKPVPNEELILSVERVLRERSIQRELYYLRQKNTVLDKEFICESDVMKKLVADATKIAKTNYNVLITGETGVGKEVLANIIYKNSDRKDNVFVVIDCGAFPETLIASELFGYEKGAFTDATKKTLGKVELADGGTLFLDEISNLSLDLQAKFLRVIERRNFYRVGGTSLIEVDVRFITASNVSFEELVSKNKFRKDLYYRLNEYKIVVPPLRERFDDIIPLAKYFLQKSSHELGRSAKELSKEAEKLLLNYQWPGNVRELYNVIKIVSFFAKEIIEVEDLQKVLSTGLNNSAAFGDNLDNQQELESLNLNQNTENIEKKIIERALQKTGYNKYKTADLIGISRKTLYDKIKKYGI